jgi:hypothetical protein
VFIVIHGCCAEAAGDAGGLALCGWLRGLRDGGESAGKSRCYETARAR